MTSPVRLGFTGTRFGCTVAQLATMRRLLEAIHQADILSSITPQFRHGLCVGADLEFHAEVCRVFERRNIIGHPGPGHYEANVLESCTSVRPSLSHFARNREIVDASGEMLACPATADQQMNGGTWYTIKYARRQRKPTLLILPDGLTVGTGDGWPWPLEVT